MLRKILILVVFVKVIIILAIIFAYTSLPFDKGNYETNFHYPPNSPITFQTAFKTWDAQHYLYLSEYGYKPNQHSNAFFPLFPFLIAIAAPIFQNPLLAGLFISNVLSILGIIFFYLFVKDYFKNNPELGLLSVILLLSFPTSFYFSLVYTESLFFFLVSLFFYFLYKNKLLFAGLCAFLLPLSRPIGIFIIFPLLYYTVHTFLTQYPKLSPHRLWIVLSPVLGLLLYFGIMQLTTSSFADGLLEARHFISNMQLTNILHPDIFLRNLFAPLPSGHVYLNSTIDRGFFIAYIISLFFIYKKLDRTLFIYALAVGSVPLFGSFMSYARYLLLVFPLFMILAKMLQPKEKRIFLFGIIAIFSIAQVVFLFMHVLNYWIS